MDHSDLHYPNLVNCRIVLGAAPYAVEVDGVDGGDAPPSGPVSMPPEAMRALNVRIPPAHDFSVERDVLKKKEGRSSRRSSGVASPSSTSAGSGSAATAAATAAGRPSSDREQVLQKMKGITRAARSTCASLLERKGYNLDRSVEAYFRGER
mmetsp:Transcript_60524/g.179397  ORF Transcript_60524/g.179397 Transcript_60524/m.179397 type:complete len:152 (-) Transcript_60524:318-773(-)